ncbi:hypothetical protein BJV78DRAFT_1285612 [Lactifluus subvellereus]|nr:hypothetical protein BJV78DRAFT_1285612 [Lactifluus subvellereus]
MEPTPGQHSLLTPTTDPPIIRCKTCKAPLPDASWKNCDRCRRNRTESYNRWKKSVEARKSIITGTEATPGSSLPSETEIPSTSRLNLNTQPTTFTNTTGDPRPHRLSHVQPATPSQAAGTDATPPDHRSNGRDHDGHPTGTPQLSGGTPRTAPGSPASQVIRIPEYQWCDELIDELTALPPRSNFIGKFSIISDPQVDNPARAHAFLDQLRAKGRPLISANITSSSRNPVGDACMLTISCACQESCGGRLVVSVSDDLSHPYGLTGQRISVGLWHSSR